MNDLKIDTGGGNVLDCIQVVEDVVMKHGDEIDAVCWQRIRARLAPNRGRVALALVLRETVLDERGEPRDTLDYWREMADAAIDAMKETP